MPAEARTAGGPAVRYICHGCGWEAAPDHPAVFRCPGARAGDDVDHVLRRLLDPAALDLEPRSVFLDPEPNPFRRYAPLSYTRAAARAAGVADGDLLDLVEGLDGAVAEVDGHGFRETPFAEAPALAEAIGLGRGSLRVKDETGNVSGSHKARHLMGEAIWLALQQRLGRAEARPLGIASCGNAALAAGIVAAATRTPLEVFVPPDAKPSVVERLAELGATITRCPRRADDPPGDPCYLRFIEASRERLVPFTVQGNHSGLAVEGGATLGWEIVSSLLREAGARELDHIVIQVGGGGLAAATIQALRDARSMGLVPRLPRVHTVQTTGAYPLRRAYDRLAARLLAGAEAPSARGPSPGDVGNADATARAIRDELAPDELADHLVYAATHRSEFMRPWETPPESLAYGILDDETYDWLAVVEGMLESGGLPLVVSEDRLAEAHRLAHEHTGIPAEPTGTAGLAGLLDLVDAGVVGRNERVAALFTGVER